MGRLFARNRLIRLNLGLNVAPPVADTATGGSHADDNRQQNHGQQHGVFDSGCSILAGKELSNRLECFHLIGPSKWMQETVGKP